MHIRFIVALIFIFSVSAIQASPPVADIGDSLRSILAQAKKDRSMCIGCEGIHAGSDLIDFYQKRFFEPFWVDPDGLNRIGKAFANALASIKSHGLCPEDYHYSCINQWIDHIRSVSQKGVPAEPSQLAAIDIVMTDAFMIFGSHLAGGKVDPERLYPHWLSEKRKSDVFSVLTHLPDGGTLDMALKQLAPSYDDYWRLVNAAQRLKLIVQNGGWPMLTVSKRLRKGDREPNIFLLRERLRNSGDLITGKTADEVSFDEDVELGVKNFQARHGLEIDGIVGRETREALNVSAMKRLQQALLNLERWRWLPHNLGNRYILVNPPAFTLEAYNDEQKQLTMKVIVGEAYKKTPVFSEKISYLEINPYWNVPSSITLFEILPQIKKDPNYLTKNHYRLVSGQEESSAILDPILIDWDSIGIENFPGHLRQIPGPWNSLGRIKFMFPNRFNVYLHDTPYRDLFNKNNRALSHGCIRVGNPMELALFVLQNDASWTRERIQALIDIGQRHIVGIKDPCMVHLLYWTCWVGEDGRINFRKDIYHRDQVLWDALNKVPEDRKQLRNVVSFENRCDFQAASTNSVPVRHQDE